MTLKSVTLSADIIKGDPLPQPQVFGHFVPWFTLEGATFPLQDDDSQTLDWLPEIEDMRHWRDSRSGYGRTHLHMPELGVYDSRDPEICFWQIEQALDHGLTGFIINWNGKYSVENVLTLHWLRISEAWNQQYPDRPFLYFLSLDSQARVATEGKRVATLEEDLIYIRDVLVRDHYLTREGRPIFSVFPYQDDCADWTAGLKNVFGNDQADLIWMNSTPNEGEKAAYPWIKPDDEYCQYGETHCWPEPDNAGCEWLSSFYRKANLSPGTAEYLMGAVWPGFDDQLVSWAWSEDPGSNRIRPRVICRETTSGNTLQQTAKVTADYIESHRKGQPNATLPMPLVQIVTWNDYAEASTVEPTRDYGTKPLSLLSDWVKPLQS